MADRYEPRTKAGASWDYQSKIREPLTGELIPPKRACNVGHAKAISGARKRSTRWFVAKLDEIWTAVDKGLISSADGKRRAELLKIGGEMFMWHRLLDLQGHSAPVDIEPFAEEGAAPLELRPHKQRTVRLKQGKDKHNLEYEEMAETVTSDVDTEARDAAEAELAEARRQAEQDELLERQIAALM